MDINKDIDIFVELYDKDKDETFKGCFTVPESALQKKGNGYIVDLSNFKLTVKEIHSHINEV